MYNPESVRYIIPINERADLMASQTVHLIEIHGSTTGRLALLTKYLRHTFPALDRKKAHKVIRILGFDDLIPA